VSTQCYFVHYVHKISKKLSTASMVSTGIAHENGKGDSNLDLSNAIIFFIEC